MEMTGVPTTTIADRCARQTEFLFVERGVVYSADRVRTVVQRFLSAVAGQRLGPSHWRHFQNNIEHELMIDESLSDLDASPQHDTHCPYVSIIRRALQRRRDPTQAGHTAFTADTVYGRSSAYPRQVSTAAVYMQHRENSMRWHKLLGLCCATWRGCVQLRSGSGSGSRDGDIIAAASKRRHYRARTSPRRAHHSTTATVAVADDVTDMTEERECRGDERERKRVRASNAATAAPAATAATVAPTSVPENAVHAPPTELHNELQLTRRFTPYLQALTHDKRARFRSSAQLQTLECALARQADILLVLPTGSGKTLLYLLIAHIEAREAQRIGRPLPVSIVIVPTRALVHDILRRCSACGIQAATWSTRGSPQYSVLVLAVEHTSHEAYARTLSELECAGRRPRLILDECHLNWQWAGFRPDCAQLRYRLHGQRSSAHRTILASATVPPRLEDEILQTHALDRRHLVVIRRPTYRLNIAYVVLPTKKKANSGAASAKTSHMVARLQSLIAHEHDHYHHGSPDDDDGALPQHRQRPSSPSASGRATGGGNSGSGGGGLRVLVY